MKRTECSIEMDVNGVISLTKDNEFIFDIQCTDEDKRKLGFLKE